MDDNTMRKNQTTSAEDPVRETKGKNRRRHHLLAGVGALLVLVLAVVLRTDGQAVFFSVGSYTITLPSVCLFRNFMGVECAGCGLTRCFIALAGGDFSAALQHNRVGVLFFLGVLFQLPYRSAALLDLVPENLRMGMWQERFLLIGISLLLINWTVNLSGLLMN